MQAKAITQLELKAQAEEQRAEESKAEVLQLQERLQEAEASHSQALQALGRHALALCMAFSCMRADLPMQLLRSSGHLRETHSSLPCLSTMLPCTYRMTTVSRYACGIARSAVDFVDTCGIAIVEAEAGQKAQQLQQREGELESLTAQLQSKQREVEDKETELASLKEVGLSSPSVCMLPRKGTFFLYTSKKSHRFLKSHHHCMCC